MTILVFAMLAFLIMVCSVTLINALSAPMLKHGPRPAEYPFVSILVPARDEEENIRGCLESLLRQQYPHFEILVLDDCSSDHTAEIVQNVSKQDERVYGIQGNPLPIGWTGKNWSCYQLSRHAKGDIFIFTDADNRYEPDAVLKTVGWMRQLSLDLFSTIPQQHTVTLAEKLVIPSVFMTAYCYLPLWLTYLTAFPSLAAANGQWLAFTKQAYEELDAHRSARNQIVEDTWLARFSKTQKKKILTTAGTDVVHGHMYHNWSEVWQGFSKNLFGLMGYQTLPFLLLLLLSLVGYVCPYIFVFIPSLFGLSIFAICLNLFIRLILAVKYKDPYITILLHPLAILITMIIGLNSLRVFIHGTVEWKGREIRMQ